MSTFKKIALFGAVLGTVALTAWVAPKVSRTMQLRALLKSHGLPVDKLELGPTSFKLDPEYAAMVKKEDGYAVISKHMSVYLVTGDMKSFKIVDDLIARLRDAELDSKQVSEEAAKAAAATATAETPAAAPVVGGAANDGAAPDAPAAAA